MLGETSLERKSRMLFGSCLLLLITGAFWWVDSIAEQLVLETTRSKGRDLVDMVLLSRHFTAWRHEKEVKEFAVETSEALEKNRNYAFEILTLDPNSDYTNLNSKHTTIPWERDILLDIKQQYDAKKKDVGPGRSARRCGGSSTTTAHHLGAPGPDQTGRHYLPRPDASW